jgi:hypothetical protein
VSSSVYGRIILRLTIHFIVDHKLRQVYGASLIDVQDPSPEVEELRAQLQSLANTMLLEYLRKIQSSRRKALSNKTLDKDQQIDQVSDSLELNCTAFWVPGSNVRSSFDL